MSHHDVIARIDRAVETWVGYTHPPVHPTLRDFVPVDPREHCHRCGGAVGHAEHNRTGCAACRGRPPVAHQVVCLGPYTDPLRGWILRTKFGQWHEMGTALGRLLARQLRRATPGIDDQAPVIVPVPMAWARRVYRGVDHTRLLADGMRRETGWPIRRVLARPMEPTQVSRSRSQRRKGVRIRLRRPVRPGAFAGRSVVLVDDVLTTGGTLRSARRALRPIASGPVRAAVLAVTPDPHRGKRDTPSGSGSASWELKADS